MGTANGKLGDSVYWRQRGQQRSRAYVPQPKESATYDQSAVRSLFANQRNLYGWLPTQWRRFNDPWDGAKNSFSAFMEGYDRYGASPMMKGRATPGRFMWEDQVVSIGTLTLPFTYEMSDDQPAQGSSAKITGRPTLVTNIVLTGVSYTREGVLAADILANNSWLREGDVIYAIHDVCLNDIDFDSGYTALTALPLTFHRKAWSYIRLDPKSIRSLPTDSLPMIFIAGNISGTKYLCMSNTNLNEGTFGTAGEHPAIGAVVVGRPSNVKRQRYTFATLKTNLRPRSLWTDLDSYLTPARMSYYKQSSESL